MNWMKPLALLFVVLLAPALAFAEEDSKTNADDLAKAAQNPLATMVTLPMQFNYNTGFGEYDRTFFNLNVQPVVPFQGENWNVIARAIIPINSVPLGETGSDFGLGDATLTFFFSPAKGSGLTWGVGPIFSLPTSSNPEILGSGKFGVGPSGVVFFSTGKWTMGAVASNTWSVAGDGDRDDTNLLIAQYFLNYNFGHGWALGTAPVISCNWEADSGNQWTIPWGLQVSKLTHFGNRPVNLMIGYYENSDYPEGGSDSKVVFQVNFLFPTGK